MIQIKRSELKQLTQNKLGDDSLESQNKVLVMISTSLAARTSYTVVGDEKEIDYERMIGLHDRLIEMRHDSPLEHCARTMDSFEYFDFQKGKLDTVDVYITDIDEDTTLLNGTSLTSGWCRNFKGFIQYRHLIENKKYE